MLKYCVKRYEICVWKFFLCRKALFLLAERGKCRSKIFKNRTTQRAAKYIEETRDIFPYLSAQCIAEITFEVTTKPYPSKVRRVLMIVAEQSIVAVCKRYSKVILVVASKIGTAVPVSILKMLSYRERTLYPPEIFKILAFHEWISS